MADKKLDTSLELTDMVKITNPPDPLAEEKEAEGYNTLKGQKDFKSGLTREEQDQYNELFTNKHNKSTKEYFNIILDTSNYRRV